MSTDLIGAAGFEWMILEIQRDITCVQGGMA